MWRKQIVTSRGNFSADSEVSSSEEGSALLPRVVRADPVTMALCFYGGKFSKVIESAVW